VQKQYVIIVAGGIGSRMKADRPKQFIEVGGQPIIVRTIRCFLEYNPGISIIISVHRNYRSHLEGLLEKFNLRDKDIRITFGGETRFDSVKNGLMLIENGQGIVGIHDSARPFVSQETIRNCFEVAAIKGNAIPCISIGESMRKISNNVNSPVNRNEFKLIQTPQCFHVSLIKKAFEQPYSLSFTDDATVLESSGERINLVEGNEENIKITSPHDLLVANALIKR
jgi:2-C-methyl-D-erythritol 4-phosphate cytidylyltransferase